MVHVSDIKHWIEAGIPVATVEVSGDGHHFEAVVVCAAFEGLTMLEQHRMVYEALGTKMQSDIHALSLRTLTPDQTGKYKKT